MSFGYNGKILRINLRTGEFNIEENDEKFYRTYMGGRCIGAYYLLKELTPKTDPLTPENKLIFAASVVTGAPAPGLSRYSVMAKSPLTGLFGESQAGGFWGAELKFAGYDALIIEDKAEEPVYLWIHNGAVEIKRADKLWGKDTKSVEQAIRSELDDNLVRIAQIGPAGENLVRYAAILNECKHANGRCGMGAVMGSKNLKAIAVRGDKKSLQMKDEDIVRALAKKFAAKYMENPDNEGLNTLGTGRYLNPLNITGQLPTRNFQTGQFEGAEKISGEAMYETILSDTEGCYACPVRCKRVVETEEDHGHNVDPYFGGPEYETLAAFGSNCGVDDLNSITKANELCNRYGLDTISTGASIAFAMECFEKGIISLDDIELQDLSWGNGQAMVKLVEKIVQRDGIGDTLAEGVSRASEKWGQETSEFALTTRDKEFPMHDPRGKGMLTWSYALTPIGADHTVVEHDTDFDFDAPEVYMEQAKSLGILDRLETRSIDSKKMRMFYYLKHHFSFMDTLCLCLFAFAPVRTFTMADLVDLVSAITGWEVSLWEIMKLGERSFNMARAFSVREGSDAKDDKLPKRMFQPIRSGPLQGVKVDKEEFEESLKRFYRMANWNSETGVPTREKLQELDIEWIADELGLD